MDMKYFVLKPGGNSRHHKASRHAMRAYARFIKQFDEKFAEEICKWANDEAAKYSSLPEEDYWSI